MSHGKIGGDGYQGHTWLDGVYVAADKKNQTAGGNGESPRMTIIGVSVHIPESVIWLC